MKPLITMILTMIMLCFSACSDTQPDMLDPVPVETLSASDYTDPTIPQTIPAATQPLQTEPAIHTLGILPGSYLDRFTDPKSGCEMDYYLHIPENATADLPLFIFLHGDGEVGNPYILKNFGMMESAHAIYGYEFPFIGLSPCTEIKSWIDGDIPITLKSLIDNIIELYAIDSNRVIITGHSRGAIGVWNMISIYGDFFAGAVPISSAHQKGHIDFTVASLVPVWSFAGNIGESELWNHKWLQYNKNAIINNGGWAEFTILPGCNHGETSNSAFTEETFQWMLEQTNKEK